MPTSLKHGPKYKCRKVNRGRHTLEMRTNGTWHDIPNTTHLREKWRRKEGILQNQIGEARLLKLLNIAAWLISTCSHPRPFCLCLGDHALAPCVLAPYVYHAKAKTRNQQTSNGRKRCKEHMKEA